MTTFCPECEAEIVELTKLYECGSCGEVFGRDDSADGDSNRCPQCNKFAALSEQVQCPECGAQDDPSFFEANNDDDESESDD